MSAEQVAQLTDREKALRKKHKDIKLSKEDLDRIHTWLDLNGVYYPEYLTAYPGDHATSGRSPLDGRQLGRLQKLTGVHMGSLRRHGRKQGPQFSFERSELSPCLQKLDKNSAQYKEALAIIKAGAETLKKKPRCDMPGFVPCAIDRRRMDRRAWYEGVERQFKAAISEGRKRYDRDIEPWSGAKEKQ